MLSFAQALRNRPVIAAARDIQGVRAAGASAAEAIFLLGGSILTLEAMVAEARAAGKRVFIHLDLVEGLGSDAAAVQWCASKASPDGLISTRAPLLKKAGDCGLLTIQRLFVMDSSSLQHGQKLLKSNRPDMVEVLPGLVPKAITTLSRALSPMPIIAGGMITEPGDARGALAAGALAVSSSSPALWNLSRADIMP